MLETHFYLQLTWKHCCSYLMWFSNFFPQMLKIVPQFQSPSMFVSKRSPKPLVWGWDGSQNSETRWEKNNKTAPRVKAPSSRRHYEGNLFQKGLLLLIPGYKMSTVGKAEGQPRAAQTQSESPPETSDSLSFLGWFLLRVLRPDLMMLVFACSFN